MKKLIQLLMIIVACCSLQGCMFVPTSQGTVHRWQKDVGRWLPVGTPTEDVLRIMKLHGFATVSVGDVGMSFYKDTPFNTVYVSVPVVNGRSAAPPSTDVMRPGGI